jgi:hypothetical protein
MTQVLTAGTGRPFIPAVMDDAGLSAAAFRVLCRISRRGICTESFESMAAGCRLHRKTIEASVADLINRGMVRKDARSGQTSVLTCAPRSEWAPTPNGYLPQKNTEVSKAGKTYPKRIPTHLPQTDTYKGSPFKVLPLRRGVGRFQKPSIEELKQAFAKAGMPEAKAQEFLDFYESNGWKVGKNPMRSWQHAVGTWKARWTERRPLGGQAPTPTTPQRKTDAQILLEAMQ